MNIVTHPLVSLRDWIRAIDYGDPETNRTSFFLQSASLLTIAGALIVAITFILDNNLNLFRTWVLVLSAFGLVVILVRLKHLDTAKALMIVSMLGIVALELFVRNGMRGIGSLLFSVIIIFASVIISSRRIYILYIGLLILVIGFLMFSESQGGLFEMALAPPAWTMFFIYSLVAVSIAAMVRFMTETLFASLALATVNERELVAQKTLVEKAEARWRSLLLNSPVIIAQVTPDGLVKFVNAEYLGVFTNTLTNYFFDFLNVEYRELAQQALKQCFETGQTSKHQVQGVGADGQSAWYEVTVGPVSERGRIDSLILIVSDISELRHAEQVLRESEARQHALLDAIPELVFRIREDGVFLDYHAPDHSHLLVPPGAFLGKSARDVLPSHVAKQLMSGIAQLRQTDKVVEFEYSLEMNGEPRFFEARMVGASPDQVLATVRDITERQVAEQSLRRAEENYHSIVENALEGIFQSTPEGRFISVNPALAKMYGYASPAEMISSITNIPEQLYVDPNTRALLGERLKSETFIRGFEAQERCKDGATIWTCTNLRLVFDDQGNTIYYEGTVEDIGARKHAMAERERLFAELESKNAELERFAYTVSHDLKSPLITIRGFLGLVEKDALAGDFDNLKVDSAHIIDATDKMQHLVNELLELSRAGRMMNNPEAVAFENIIREAVNLVAGQIAAHHVQMEIALDLPTVYGDRTRLIQVLQNLIDNAVKFMGDQPQPHIDIGMRGTDADGKPVLFVRDNGIGIGDQYHDNVFGLFTKLDAHSEGTGIGLALVKRIVQVHGGRIWVESEGPGKGSTFCFTLPSAPSTSKIREQG